MRAQFKEEIDVIEMWDQANDDDDLYIDEEDIVEDMRFIQDSQEGQDLRIYISKRGIPTNIPYFLDINLPNGKDTPQDEMAPSFEKCGRFGRFEEKSIFKYP